ncbi:MAG: hypothetical protein LZF86_210116 [Nitrospira sp.]|nr:MAG: hypothetical protein LZF86_210116 [Nitrospira sp.]
MKIRELLRVPVEENILIRLSLRKNLTRLHFAFKAIYLTVLSPDAWIRSIITVGIF